jgi:hypothetical protein
MRGQMRLQSALSCARAFVRARALLACHAAPGEAHASGAPDPAPRVTKNPHQSVLARSAVYRRASAAAAASVTRFARHTQRASLFPLRSPARRLTAPPPRPPPRPRRACAPPPRPKTERRRKQRRLHLLDHQRPLALRRRRARPWRLRTRPGGVRVQGEEEGGWVSPACGRKRGSPACAPLRAVAVQEHA